MNFEILVEDLSGKKMLDILLPRIIGAGDTFQIHSFKGKGALPKNLKNQKDKHSLQLLNTLPNRLRAYGNMRASQSGYPQAVIVICDLDDDCLKEFLSELDEVLNACDSQPLARFCIAIEEGEAWLLGDRQAIKKAYPKAKDKILVSYENDSICGTWELLADAVYQGGSKSLSAKSWVVVGTEKSVWAEAIAPHMDIHHNNSPSFRYFIGKIQEFAQPPE